MSDTAVIDQACTDFDRKNPWASQTVLMKASEQVMAQGLPELNKGTLLYSALSLEEGSETMRGISNVLSRIANEQLLPPEMLAKISEIFVHVDMASTQMHEHSLAIRETLKTTDDFAIPLKKEEAKEIGDGCTDTIVVTTGLSESSGLKGEKLFVEIVGSNLSKRNPKTGKIDKTPDGKWIKGEEYFEPNILPILYPEPEN